MYDSRRRLHRVPGQCVVSLVQRGLHCGAEWSYVPDSCGVRGQVPEIPRRGTAPGGSLQRHDVNFATFCDRR
jgi:hypothetical protein